GVVLEVRGLVGGGDPALRLAVTLPVENLVDRLGLCGPGEMPAAERRELAVDDPGPLARFLNPLVLGELADEIPERGHRVLRLPYHVLEFRLLLAESL